LDSDRESFPLPVEEDFVNRRPAPRKTVNLSESFHHQLNMYALAAGAAGVGMLALTTPAQAKIAYTPAHLKLHGQLTQIDLNHDGISDFVLEIYRGYGVSASFFLIVYPSPGNGAVGTAEGWFKSAVALRDGARIGPRRLFNEENPGQMVNRKEGAGGTGYWAGQFADGGKGVKKRYLGFQFLIKGKIHYGWARIRIDIHNGTFTAFLDGYAYETIPNKPIVAGQTKGTDDIDNSTEQSQFLDPGPGASLTSPIPSIQQAATLGALALGAPGLSIWRREETQEAIGQ
jgi:hypothetical protein